MLNCAGMIKYRITVNHEPHLSAYRRGCAVAVLLRPHALGRPI